ncbi:MAG: DUF983 domain-containing protein [Alphaproteobacteria bacterium]|nr:DUF983 domain-containing protein [Alphaproteobacteria bacterium]
MADTPPPSSPSPPPSLFFAGLLCRCPRCGQGALFQGYIRVRETCSVCGENLAALEQGDGPAVFVITIMGFLVVGLALLVEIRYAPPLWVHALLWLPLILGGALGLLRPLKAIMVGIHYRYRKGDVERG